MVGVPNACGRFRDSGKPVTGLSRLDLSSLVAPWPRVVRDTESQRLYIARILTAPFTSDGHRLARVIGSLILAGGLLREPALLDALKRTDSRRIAPVSVHQQTKIIDFMSAMLLHLSLIQRSHSHFGLIK